jgi:hypothetical protein
MATKIVTLTSPDTGLGFWQHFQDQLERHVREYNATAGSRIWVIRTGPSPSRFTISSTLCDGDAVEFAFDADSSTLVCTPGPAVNAPAMRLQWTARTGLLEGEGLTLRIDEALQLLLDELVCVDEEPA